jgi:hypothetical protein
MTAAEMTELIHRTGGYQVGELRIDVCVLGVRMDRGFVEVQIQPLSGSGEIWVRPESVEWD